MSGQRRALCVLAVAVTVASLGSAWAGEDSLVRFGAIATLAPLCGLRDDAWSQDLRRAQIRAATGTERFDDEALRRAPGRAEAEAALSYAETEANEDFAVAAPERTCGPLAADPALARADAAVRAFRERRDPAGS